MHIHNPNVPPPIDELRVSNFTKGLERGRYTWEKKYATVAVYLKCGSLRETERTCGVPVPTLENWRKSEWWDGIVTELQKEEHAVKNTKLTQIINKALGVVEDRLENGELILNNKTGELVRKPVSIRDATRAAGELMQRQESMNKALAVDTVHKQTVDETLKFLATEFAKMVNKKPEVIDLEDATYAIHEERETRLQEGSSSIHEQTGSDQEA